MKGQWRNDTMHGQGYFKTHTGYCCEGVFINGLPKELATQLQIKTDQDLEKGSIFRITEGRNMFNIKVNSVNDEANIFTGICLFRSLYTV